MLFSLFPLSLFLFAYLGYLFGSQKFSFLNPKPLILNETQLPSKQEKPKFRSSSSSNTIKKSDSRKSLTPEPTRSTPESQPKNLELEKSNNQTPRRVIIVAKHLPIKCTYDGNWSSEWHDSRSFLSNMRSISKHHLELNNNEKSYDVCFVGLAEEKYMNVPPEEQKSYVEHCEAQNCIPVFLTNELYELYMTGMCKSVLWPLLHYVTPRSLKVADVRWAQIWPAYLQANQIIAGVIAEKAVKSPTDYVWLHNYHLLCVPSFLRGLCPKLSIGMFLHTTFPSSDIFRSLPTRAYIMSSVMCSDLIGFHTFDYARHFLSCIKRVLDLDFETLAGGLLGVKKEGRFVSILISHVGIASEIFAQQRLQSSIENNIKFIQSKHSGRKIVFGGTDLDLVKQPLLKIQAYYRFLQKYPEQVDKVVFIELLQISKNSVEHQSTKELLLNEISKIKMDFGNEVIEFISPDGEGSFSIADLVAYYGSATVGCFTPFFDGLNLMPFEFTASQKAESPGALILSEFVGGARSLNGCYRVNPFSFNDLADALNSCLEMNINERKANHQRRYNYVMNHTAKRWAYGFLEALEKANKLSSQLNFVEVGKGNDSRLLGIPPHFQHLFLHEHDILQSYAQCGKRVLLLDYDGTLAPADKVNFAEGGKNKIARPSPAIMALLSNLTADENNCVFIMSGRTRLVLTQFFSALPELGLAAEKGLFLKWPKRLQSFRNRNILQTDSPSESEEEGNNNNNDGELISNQQQKIKVNNKEWEPTLALGLDDLAWKETAYRVIQTYCESTDGSWIEVKEFALVWHFENADPEYGRMQAADLQKYLHKVLHNPAVDVTRYDLSQILEVKPHGVSKGHAATTILDALFHTSTELEVPALKRSFSTPTAKREEEQQEDLTGFATCKEPFLLAIGDDRSDESMFESLLDRNLNQKIGKLRTVSSWGINVYYNEKEIESNNNRKSTSLSNIWTVTVGCKPSHAQHYLNDAREVVKLLDNCTKQVFNQEIQENDHNLKNNNNKLSESTPPNSVQQLTRRILRKVTNS